jgi:opacity protein-like surface antigen
MISYRASFFRRTGLVACGIALGAMAPALAQNSEGSHQVRVGAFLDTGATRLTDTISGDSATTGRFGVGGSAGLEFLRKGGWTLGVEADLGLTGGGAPNVNGVRYGADYFGSLRGRVGVYARPDLVVYGTGGLGFRGVTVDDSVPGASSKIDKTLYGGIFGGGLELHRGNSIFFFEYLHANYAGADAVTTTTSAFGGTTTVGTYRVKAEDNSFRLGMKFKVGFDGYHDEVRDGLRR